jgi:hypothetical protein
MYLVTLKVQRKEGVKPKKEVYLVDAVGFTDIESKVNKEFKEIPITLSACKEVSFTEIFENGKGTFSIIKIVSEDIDSKVEKETFLQEASDLTEAEKLLRESITYGEKTNSNLTDIMGIIR